MTLVADLLVQLRGETGDLESKMGGVSSAFGVMGAAAEAAAAVVGGAFIAIGASVASTVVDVGSSLDKFKISMETLTGSVDTAAQKMQVLRQVAETTGVPLKGLEEASVHLAAFNNGILVTSERMKEVAGVSTLFGGNTAFAADMIRRLIDTASQFDPIAGRIANQLQQAGVGGREWVDQLNNMIKAGANWNDIYALINENLHKFSDVGGRIGKETLPGIITELRNIVGLNLTDAFKPLLDGAKDIGIALQGLASSSGFKAFLKDIADSLAGILPIIKEWTEHLKNIDFSKLTADFDKLKSIAVPVLTVVAGLFSGFAAELLSTIPGIGSALVPLGGAFTGIATAVTLMIVASEKGREALGNLIKSVSDVVSSGGSGLASTFKDLYTNIQNAAVAAVNLGAALVRAIGPEVLTAIKLVATGLSDIAGAIAPLLNFLTEFASHHSGLVQMAAAFIAIKFAMEAIGITAGMAALGTWFASMGSFVAEAGVAATSLEGIGVAAGVAVDGLAALGAGFIGLLNPINLAIAGIVLFIQYENRLKTAANEAAAAISQKIDWGTGGNTPDYGEQATRIGKYKDQIASMREEVEKLSKVDTRNWFQKQFSEGMSPEIANAASRTDDLNRQIKVLEGNLGGMSTTFGHEQEAVAAIAAATGQDLNTAAVAAEKLHISLDQPADKAVKSYQDAAAAAKASGDATKGATDAAVDYGNVGGNAINQNTNQMAANKKQIDENIKALELQKKGLEEVLKAQEAQQAHEKLLRDIEKATKDIAKANEDVVDAQRAVVKATEAVADAQKGVEQAIKAVAKAQEDVLKAQRDYEKSIKDVEKAQKDVQKAIDDVGKAEKDVVKAQEDVLKATKDVEKAQKDVEKAIDNVAKAQKDVQKAVEEVTKAQEGLAKAVENVTKAENDLVKANEKLADDQAKQSGTQMDLAAAMKFFGDTVAGLTTEHWDLYKAVRELNPEQQYMGDQLRAQIAITDDLKRRVDQLNDSYKDEQAQLRLVTDQIKAQQDIMKAPLVGEGEHARKLQQIKETIAQLELQKSALTWQGVYSGDPRMKALDVEIAKQHQLEQDENNRYELTIGHQKFEIDQAQKMAEVQASAQLAAAQAVANLLMQQKAIQSVLDSQKVQIDAQTEAYTLQKQKTTDLTAALKEVASADAQIRSVNDAIVADQQAVLDATQKIRDANVAVKDAQDKIVEAEQKVMEATDKVKEAEDAVKDATDKVKEAQDKVKDATDHVKDAQDRVKDATDKVKDAEDKVKDAQDRVKDAADKVKTAQDNVGTATDNVRKAEERVQDANIAVQKAVENVATAQDHVTEAIQHSKDLQQQLVNEPLKAAIAAIQEEITKQQGFSAAIQDSITKQQALNAAAKAYTPPASSGGSNATGVTSSGGNAGNANFNTSGFASDQTYPGATGGGGTYYQPGDPGYGGSSDPYAAWHTPQYSTSGGAPQGSTQPYSSGGGYQGGYANGGFAFFAGGGMEDHSAQIVPAGAWRVFGEPETGGEAYIPLGMGKRTQAWDVLSQVATMFGAELLPQDGRRMADGASSINPVALSGGSGHSGLIIGEGAVKVSIVVQGDAPANLKSEVEDAVRGSITQIVEAWRARGGQ